MKAPYRLSDASLRLEGQPMFKVLARVKELERQGEDIVHFEIGDPDFNTPGNIVEAACASLRAGESHYEDSMGLHEFREQVVEATFRSRGFRPDISQVLVTPGANIAIYYAIRCLVNPGDEIIVPDPGFPTYYSAIAFCGAKAVRVPLLEKNKFRMQPEDVEARITGKTRLVIINSPHNPTGSVMTPEQLDAMARIAEKHDVFLYSDEIYSRMIHDPGYKFHSPGRLDGCKTRIMVSNGFSKAFAMTGWRLGVVIGPEDVIAKMGLLLQTTSSCVPPFVQRAGMEAMCGDQAAVWAMMSAYRERIAVLVEGLNGIRGVSCIAPEGAFYIFPNISGTGMTSEQFADFALEKAKVALLPGSNFGEMGQGYARLCCATSMERINEGLERLKKAVEA